MTVKELINKLQQFDEDKLVLVEDTDLTCLTGFVLQWAKYGLKK